MYGLAEGCRGLALACRSPSSWKTIYVCMQLIAQMLVHVSVDQGRGARLLVMMSHYQLSEFKTMDMPLKVWKGEVKDDGLVLTM